MTRAWLTGLLLAGAGCTLGRSPVDDTQQVTNEQCVASIRHAFALFLLDEPISKRDPAKAKQLVAELTAKHHPAPQTLEKCTRLYKQHDVRCIANAKDKEALSACDAPDLSL